MSEHSPNDLHQNLNISGDASLENVQIGGIASRDLNVTQIQGQVVYVNVNDHIYAPDGLSQKSIKTAKPLTHQEYRYRQVLLDKVKNIWILQCVHRANVSASGDYSAISKRTNKEMAHLACSANDSNFTDCIFN